VFNNAGLSVQKIVNISNSIPTIFKNKRDIIKFSNSLLFSFSLNKGEIYLTDHFALEMIKFSDSTIYNLLAGSTNYLEIYTTSPNILKYRLYTQPAKVSAADDHYEIIDKIYNQQLKKLVNSLFSEPELNDIHADKSIVNVDKFSRYFIFATQTL